jgi:hypothetical protein
MSVILITAVVVWGIFLWVLGLELTWDHAKPYTLTLTTLTLGWAVFNSFLWRVWPCKYFSGLPDINGTWCVSLQSSYKDPATNKICDPVKGFAVIRQTFSSLSIRVMTQQSESSLVAHSYDRHLDGTTHIYGVYQSDPNIQLRGELSEIHYGSLKYKIIGSPVLQMAGNFWTDRHTNGTIELKKCCDRRFDSFLEAQEALKSKAD